MSQLWSDERIITEIQQCIQGVENSEVALALQTAVQTMRNDYEQRIAQLEAQQWQPVVEDTTISCVEKAHNILAYIVFRDKEVVISTRHHMYVAALSPAYRLCKRMISGK